SDPHPDGSVAIVIAQSSDEGGIAIRAKGDSAALLRAADRVGIALQPRSLKVPALGDAGPDEGAAGGVARSWTSKDDRASISRQRWPCGRRRRARRPNPAARLPRRRCPPVWIPVASTLPDS